MFLISYQYSFKKKGRKEERKEHTTIKLTYIQTLKTGMCRLLVIGLNYAI